MSQAAATRHPTQQANTSSSWVGSEQAATPGLREKVTAGLRARVAKEAVRGEGGDFLEEIHAPDDMLDLKKQEFVMLKDLMYMNMKRYRHQNFMAAPSLCAVIRDREGRNDDFSLR